MRDSNLKRLPLQLIAAAVAVVELHGLVLSGVHALSAVSSNSLTFQSPSTWLLVALAGAALWSLRQSSKGLLTALLAGGVIVSAGMLAHGLLAHGLPGGGALESALPLLTGTFTVAALSLNTLWLRKRIGRDHSPPPAPSECLRFFRFALLSISLPSSPVPHAWSVRGPPQMLAPRAA